MNNLLYFPYINLPNTDWTIRTLMYYDTVASIVPIEYFEYPEDNYEPYMLELVKNELVIPIDPMKKLDSPFEISKPFFKFLNHKSFDLNKRRNHFLGNKTSKIHMNKFIPKGSKIHAEKFDGEIFNQLEYIGLAKRDKKNPRWYIVESKTADLLMTYLAFILSSKMKMRPATDSFKIPRIIKKGKIELENNEKTRKRETILKELIPFPQEINFIKLRKFKEKYLDLLEAFKNRVELIVLDEQIIEGTELFDEKVNELRLRKEELSARMNESQMKNIIFGSICGVIGAYQGLAIAETIGAVLGALPGFISAIHSALKVEKAEKIFDQTGMKYIALMDKLLK